MPSQPGRRVIGPQKCEGTGEDKWVEYSAPLILRQRLLPYDDQLQRLQVLQVNLDKNVYYYRLCFVSQGGACLAKAGLVYSRTNCLKKCLLVQNGPSYQKIV